MLIESEDLKEWIEKNDFIPAEEGYIYGLISKDNLLDKIKQLEDNNEIKK